MTYEIKQIKSTFFSTVVYAISFENPLQELSSISRELTSIIHKPCNVLFDLLLSNSYSLPIQKKPLDEGARKLKAFV